MKTAARRLRVALAPLLLLTMLLTSGGCWDRVEIENIAFVSIVGVDRAGDGKMLVSFYVVNPDALGKKGGGSAPPDYVHSVQARDVPLAVARYAEESPRLVRFKQLQAIIIGEDLARQGVGPVLDYFSRHWEMRRSIWVLVAKGKAQDILIKGKTPPEKLSSAGIKGILDQKQILTSTRYPVVLGDFLTAITRTGSQPIASSVELYPMREATTGASQGGQAQDQAKGSGSGSNSPGAQSSSVEQDKVLAFKGAGVFREDKLLDFLSPSETRGVLWVQGKIQGCRMMVPASGQGNQATLAVERETTDVQPVVDQGKIRFLITIHEAGYVVSVDTEQLAAGQRDTIMLLEQEQEEAIRQEVMGAVSKARSLQSDFLGLGDRLYRKDPGAWKQVKDNWNTAWLPQVDIDVNVKCELRNTGSSADPLPYTDHHQPV